MFKELWKHIHLIAQSLQNLASYSYFLDGLHHRADRVLSFFSNRPNRDPPPPNPSHDTRRRVCTPPPLFTRLREREWYCGTLSLSTYIPSIVLSSATATAMLPEIVEITQQHNSISRETNSLIRMPTTQVFCENSPKSIQNGEKLKFVKKDTKNSKSSPFYVR
jgi:hypothetical protein